MNGRELWVWHGGFGGQSPTNEGRQQKMEQGADYEEALETAIPLRDNQAYGHVDLKRKN